MARPTKKITLVTARGCRACDVQKKYIKKQGYTKDFKIVEAYIIDKHHRFKPTAEGKKLMKQVKINGYDINSTPTMFCAGFQCKETGMKIERALDETVKRNRAIVKELAKKNPNLPSKKSKPKKKFKLTSIFKKKKVVKKSTKKVTKKSTKKVAKKPSKKSSKKAKKSTRKITKSKKISKKK